MESWIQKQTVGNNSSYEIALRTKYPEAAKYSSDPDRYVDRICFESNFLDGVRGLDWEKYIPANAKVLDLAGGIGWLSAFLSSISAVKEITIVDISRNYLKENLPVSVKRLNGDLSKIKAIEGYFIPILLEDASLDLVVVSSSLHHAESLEAVLKEIQRVLVPGGRCLVLNETPVGNFLYLKHIFVALVRILNKICSRTYMATSPSISASGFLYDPLLGDRLFPDWYWIKSISMAGFVLEKRINTTMATMKGAKGLRLVHYVCRKDS